MLEDLKAIVGDKHVYTDPKTRKVFSTDAYTFSPVLVEALGRSVADIVVAPGSVAELRAVLGYAVGSGLPVTVRGAGTGNYGQSVPLAGGVQILTRRLNRVLELDPAGWARVEPGVVMGLLERRARAVGLELRCYPSTYATATIGGFVGGGFGGVGSVRHGTLWDGAVLAAELLTAEAEPRAVTLGPGDLQAVIHAYGVTGVVTELTVGLAPALPWEESVLDFGGLESALRFAYALAADDGFDKRLISLHEPPIPSFFKPLVQEGGVAEGRVAVLLELAEGQIPAAAKFAETFGGRLSWTRGSEGYHKSRFSLSDFSWNHTTLWAMKADPGYTYLQAQFAPTLEGALEQITTLKTAYGDEVPMHLEIVRIGGKLTVSALPLVRYRDRERLYDIIASFEAQGVEIADPHTYRLDHDPRWQGAPVLEAKARWNPTGLLNPGKLGELPPVAKAVQEA